MRNTVWLLTVDTSMSPEKGVPGVDRRGLTSALARPILGAARATLRLER
jgi:hypothetical protein